MKKTMKLTKEQSAIQAHDTSKNRIVIARAGTGKSTTIRMIAEPESTILCYNKAPAKEMQAELTNGAVASTFHSFGKDLMPKGSSFNKAKLHWLVRDLVFNSNNPTNAEGWELFNLLKLATNWLKDQATHPDASLEEIKQKLLDERFDGGTRIDEMVPLCKDILVACASKKTWKGRSYHEYDLADMQWLPFVHGWGKAICPYLYVDEGQDINPIRLALVKLWAGGHITVVGDDMQAIYQYQGAIQNCLEEFANILKAKKYPLTTSWRCPTSHIELAQKIVPDIKAAPKAISGTINDFDSLPEDIDPAIGCLIISRTNAPNIRAYYNYRKTSDLPVVIMNSDIAETLCTLVGSEYEVKNSINAAWHSKYAMKIEKKKKYCRTPSGAAIIDDHDSAIQTILSQENPKSVGQFHEVIRTQFGKPEVIPKNAIRLSSAHGTKGLEHHHTILYGTEKFPHPMAKLQWERDSETKLLYVAQTRSKNRMDMIPSND